MACSYTLDGDSVQGSMEDSTSGTVALHSKTEQRKVMKKKELLDSFSDEITNLFESLNNKYLKKELKNKKTVIVSNLLENVEPSFNIFDLQL